VKGFLKERPHCREAAVAQGSGMPTESESPELLYERQRADLAARHLREGKSPKEAARLAGFEIE